MALCLFIKPFRALKGRLQIKGDIKRHCFTPLIRRSFVTGGSALVERRTIYFLDEKSSPGFAATSDDSTQYALDERDLGDRSQENDTNAENIALQQEPALEIDEENELDELAQKAVDNALWKISTEFMTNFASKFVRSVIKNAQIQMTLRDEKSATTDVCSVQTRAHEDYKEELIQEEKVKQSKADDDVGSTSASRRPDVIVSPLSPIDYTELCVPRDYSVFGNRVGNLRGRGQREAVLLRRGIWPSDEAIDYQFEFVEMMQGVERENETAGDHRKGNTVDVDDANGLDVIDKLESEDSDDDDDGLTITFEVGPAEINRYPAQRRSTRRWTQEDVINRRRTREERGSKSPTTTPSLGDQFQQEGPRLEDHRGLSSPLPQSSPPPPEPPISPHLSRAPPTIPQPQPHPLPSSPPPPLHPQSPYSQQSFFCPPNTPPPLPYNAFPPASCQQHQRFQPHPVSPGFYPPPVDMYHMTPGHVMVMMQAAAAAGVMTTALPSARTHYSSEHRSQWDERRYSKQNTHPNHHRFRNGQRFGNYHRQVQLNEYKSSQPPHLRHDNDLTSLRQSPSNNYGRSPPSHYNNRHGRSGGGGGRWDTPPRLSRQSSNHRQEWDGGGASNQGRNYHGDRSYRPRSNRI